MGKAIQSLCHTRYDQITIANLKGHDISLKNVSAVIDFSSPSTLDDLLKICLENNISFSLMEPILKKTINQAINYNPDELQTGPAMRNDKNTLGLHINLIKNVNDKILYEIITKSIQKNYE